MTNFFAHLISAQPNLAVIGICVFVPLLVIILCRKNLNLPIVQSIPAFCTAIGIMFTFGIIYCALGINEDLFKDNEIASLQKVVKTLSNKFSCSLIGVFFSVAWSLAIKGIISFQESRANRKSEWMERGPQEILWSLEQNFIKMFREYSDNTETITKSSLLTAEHSKGLLERMVTVVETFDESAREDLRKTLDDLKDALKESLADLGQNAFNESQKYITTTNNKFLETAQNMQTANQSELAKLLKVSTETFTTNLQKLDAIGVQIQAEMKNIRNGAEKGSSDIIKGFESSADTIKGSTFGILEAIKQEFNSINERFKNLDKELHEATQDVLDKNLAKLEKTFNKLEDIQANSINRLEESSKQFNESIHNYETLQNHHYEVLERVEHQILLLKQLQENAESQLKEWSDQVDEMEEVRNRVADIANTIDELQEIKESLAALSTRN